jgi:hypothetical protein
LAIKETALDGVIAIVIRALSVCQGYAYIAFYYSATNSLAIRIRPECKNVANVNNNTKMYFMV